MHVIYSPQPCLSTAMPIDHKYNQEILLLARNDQYETKTDVHWIDIFNGGVVFDMIQCFIFPVSCQ
jgi:hypothetical protein